MVLCWLLQAQLEREENWQVERESLEGKAHTLLKKAKTKRNLGSGNSTGWMLEGGVCSGLAFGRTCLTDVCWERRYLGVDSPVLRLGRGRSFKM